MEKNFFDKLENDIISNENKNEEKTETKTAFNLDEYLDSVTSNNNKIKKTKTNEINNSNNEILDNNKEKKNNILDFNESNFNFKKLKSSQITYKTNNQNPKKLFEDIFNNEEEKKLEEDLYNSLKGKNSIKTSKTLKIKNIFIENDKNSEFFVDDLKKASQKQKEENKNVSDNILLKKINDEENNLINIEILKLMKYIESDNIDYLINEIKESIIRINENYNECYVLYKEMIYKSKGNKTKINEFFNWIELTFKTFLESSNVELFSNFSSFFYNNISELLEISETYTSKIIDLYYNDTDEKKEKIIKELDNYPELQLKYLNNYIEIYNMKENIDEEYISDFLEKKIKLLIVLNHKEQVIHVFNDYPFLCNFINNEEYINLFKKNNIGDVAIHLLLKQEKNEEAFSFSLNEVNKYFNDILYLLNESSFNENKFNIFLEKYNYYLNFALNICSSYEKKDEENNVDNPIEIKKKEEEKEKNFNLWINLFQCLYENFKKFLPYYSQNKNNEKTIHYYILNESLNKNKSAILRKITDVQTINNVIEIFVDKIKGIEIKEFHEILQELMNNYNKMMYIMKIGLETLNNTIFFGLNNIIKILKKGYNFSLNFCSFCGKDIRENGLENIYLFTCHHHYHQRCCAFENEKYICYICAKKESYFSVFNENNFNIENKNYNDIFNTNKEEEKEKKNLEKKIEFTEKQKKIKKINLNKLKEMKKKHNDLIKLMINFKKGNNSFDENFYN